jgi:hypothetical protein
MNRHTLRNLILVLLAAWLAIVITLAAGGVFDSGFTPGAHSPVLLGLAVIAPVILFAASYAASAKFREFVFSVNPKILTLAQTWRIGGFLFLALAAWDVLPQPFANIAGWGDIFIGATAPLCAYFLVLRLRRDATIAWQALGMLDLIVAIILGVLSSPTEIGFLAEGSITTRVMGVLPMSLVPTFIVPLLFIFHVIVIAQARRWTEIDRRLASTAA